jgi:NAD(P)-dependent dehydrogenase (short-subunit alcohol dehydrogenase family)
MNIDLSGRTAIVTGSTGGIGYAIARGLAQSGAAVVINGRGQTAVDKALARLRADAPAATLHGVAADLGTAEGCAALVAAEPRTDILVNNVGIFGPRDFFDTPDEVWEHFLAVNVLSGVRLSRAWLPGMAERGWGRVIFLSSESALNIPADMIHYGVTKTADLALSRGLAKRMAGTGVTVNAILPGPTLSDGVREMLAGEVQRTGRPLEDVAADFVRGQRPSSIIRRAASVEEVANLVVYVASPLSSATTGAALRVDGGVVDTIA